MLGEPDGWHAARLAAALSARGHEVAVVPWRALAGGIATAGETVQPAAVATADVVVVRGMPGGGAGDTRLEEVIFRMNLLGRIAARGIPVINSPRSLEVAIDKHLSLCRVAAAGVPVPHTVVVQDRPAAEEAWRHFGGDCVLKPLFGSRGRGLARITSAAALAQATAREGSREALGGVFYLQEFIPHDGWDVRILLVGGRPLGMRRVAVGGDWRTNVSRGGRGEPFDPPAAWVETARRAAAAVEAEIAGVDLLPASDGRLVVLEVNGVPGWRGLESATGLDVTGIVASHVESRAKTA